MFCAERGGVLYSVLDYPLPVLSLTHPLPSQAQQSYPATHLLGSGARLTQELTLGERSLHHFSQLPRVSSLSDYYYGLTNEETKAQRTSHRSMWSRRWWLAEPGHKQTEAVDSAPESPPASPGSETDPRAL